MKAIRWLAIVLVVGAFFALIISNISNTNHADAVWNEAATVGKMDAKHYFVFYTDLACPYCSAFSLAVMDNKDEFMRDYIEGKDILYEVRVTDFLYEFGEHKPEMSRQSAEAVYCATNENKFWDYYYTALDKLYNDYYSQGVGVSKTAPAIADMTSEYWLNIGKEIGLSEEFESCYTEHKMLSKVQENTAKAAQYVQGGLPYFKFDKFTTGGFDTRWGWDYVKKYLDAGLSS